MNNMKYGVIDIDEIDFGKNMVKLIKEYGVVVIKNVIDNDECDNYVDDIVNDIEKITHFNKNDETSWKMENLPQQIRPGMFHEVICNTPTINKLRFNKKIAKIFTEYYTIIKNKNYEQKDMIVSNDGINIKPGYVPPYEVSDNKSNKSNKSIKSKKNTDWAHLDQSADGDDPYKCIQGQIVLTNTSASFRASPKSHLLFKEFLTNCMENNTNKIIKYDGFVKIKPEQYLLFQKKVEDIGGSWQIKIPANKGDFIIWTSSTIHSATLQETCERSKENDRWYGWRCVVFICYRPRDEFTKEHLKKKYKSYKKNKVTNHWSTSVFATGFVRFAARNKNKYTEQVRNYIMNPEKVFDIEGMKPLLTNDQKIMLGKSESYKS